MVELGRNDVTPCLGCFFCFTKHVGICVTRDRIAEIRNNVNRYDMTIFLTPVIFGHFSSTVKCAIDRGCGSNNLQVMVGYGDDIDDEEKSTFIDLTRKHRGKADIVHPGLDKQVDVYLTTSSEELDRMEKKTPEQKLKVELENEFGFSPIVARALLNKIDSYNASNKTSNLTVGTIFYWAASSKEPAGKAIEEMHLKQVRLILNKSSDISVLRENGMQALREVKVARITEEAKDQDSYLTQEDIAVLLCSSVRTIRRDIERLRYEKM